MPAESATPAVSRAVQVVLAGKGIAGVRVVRLPPTAYPTIPATGEPPGQARVKVALVSVSGSMPSLKPALTSVLVETALAALSGLVELTVGLDVSGAALVVKLQMNALARAFPDASLTAVDSRAEQLVLAGSNAAGVKVARLPLTA